MVGGGLAPGSGAERGSRAALVERRHLPSLSLAQKLFELPVLLGREFRPHPFAGSSQLVSDIRGNPIIVNSNPFLALVDGPGNAFFLFRGKIEFSLHLADELFPQHLRTEGQILGRARDPNFPRCSQVAHGHSPGQESGGEDD